MLLFFTNNKRASTSNLTRGLSNYTHDTTGKGHAVHICSSFQYHISQYDPSSNRTYFVWMTRNGTIYDNENIVQYLDHSTNTLSGEFNVGKTSEDVSDHHAHGTLFITSTGRVLVFRTEHISAINVAYTDNIDTTAFQELSSFSSSADYMQVSERAGIIYVHCRQQRPNQILRAYSSNDNGATWTDLGAVINMYDNTESILAVAYPNFSPLDHTNSSRIWICIAESDRTNNTFRRCSVMYTDDGYDTIHNIDDSWSKDVATNGAVTHTEWKTNCLIEEDPISSVGRNWLTGATISNQGNFYALKRKNSNAGLDFVYWNGTSWTIKEVITNYTIDSNTAAFGINLGEHTLYSINENIFDAFISEEMPSGLLQINRYRTTDKGDNWTFKETITNTSIDHYRNQHLTRNFQQYKKGVLLFQNGDGTGDEITAHEDYEINELQYVT